MKRKVAGFTLVEVLVALTVMAVMAMMAWQGVDGIVRARDSNQVRLEQTLRLNSVVGQWEQDLASIQESGVVDGFACDGSTVRLTRKAEGGLQVVAWALRPDATTSSWWRWASPIVSTRGELENNWFQSLQMQGGERGQIRALSGLSSWQVYSYRNEWANCQSTGNVTAGAPVTQADVPRGVRLVLNFAPGSGQNGSLTRDYLVKP